MKILQKYILKNVIKRFFLTTFLFLFLGILTRIVHYLDIITHNQGSIFDLLSILFLIQVKIIVVLSPFSLMIAAFLVYDGLIKANEHIAFYNIGISKINLIRPLIYFSVFLFFVNLFLSSVLVPSSYIKMEKIHTKILTQVSSTLIKPNQFIKQNNILIFTNKANEDKLINGVLIIDKRIPAKKTVMVLENAKIGLNSQYVSFNSNKAYVSRFTEYSTYPLILNFNTFEISFVMQSYLPNVVNGYNSISNKEVIKGVLNGKPQSIKEAKVRFGWPFFTILIPLSLTICLLNFLNFSRSRVKPISIIITALTVGYVVFSSMLGDIVLAQSFVGLFLYYANIFLIFVFLSFSLKLKTFS